MVRLVHMLVVFALLLGYVGGERTALFAQSASDQPLTDGAIVAAESAAIAATPILVTTNKDEWDIPALPGKVSPTKCSLREALQIIAAPGSGDRGCKNLPEAAAYTIDFAGGGVHQLTELQVLPMITKPVTINGKKQAVTIDGGATSTGLGGDEARAFGIFFVQSGGVLKLNEIVLTDGNFLAGGAINNTAGTVIIHDSRFVENQAATDAQLNGEGGAIWSTGPLSITKSFFGENVAFNEGGAIYAGGGLLQVRNPAPGGGYSNQWLLAPRQNQSIDFAAPGTQLLHNSPFSPVAIASSGLPVTFSSTTPAICTAEETNIGWRVNLLALGNCTLVATQVGDSAFNPASPIELSFQVAAVGTIYLPVALRNSKPAVQAAEATIILNESSPLAQAESAPASANAENNALYLYLPLVAQ